RFDYYQTDTSVTVTVFVKGVTEDRLDVQFGEHSLHVAIKGADGSETALKIDPLFASVNAQASAYKILSTKVEVSLVKAAPGVRWAGLQGDTGGIIAGSSNSSTIPMSVPTDPAAESSSGPSASAPGKRPSNKWDALDYDTLAESKQEEDSDINKFFQKIYANANEDTRRAMMKSFQESNGTALSTNWEEVGKGRVETQPPDGMVPRKYGA
ncbi:SGS-domain-containing protein, partial [Tilletiaria anomala UBC 951]